MQETLLNTLGEMLVRFLAFLPKAIVGVVIFFVGLYVAGLLAKMVRTALERRKTDREVTILLTKLMRWLVVTITVFVALQQMGFDLSAFLVSLGVVGFTVGFALQDISKNFIAGMLLLLQQPFDLDDLIQIGEFVGTVTDINLRSTELRLLDGKMALIPNAEVYVSPIINHTRKPLRRLDLTIGVAYDTDLELARDTAIETVGRIPDVLDEPEPSVVFQDFGDSAIGIAIYCWIDVHKSDLFSVKNDVFLALNKAFARENIEIPYPIQTVLMKQ
ncbi:MAG TPA: mechanosensitive ion channel [Anaerolineae bacterium]|nr:mechanosensitive ion channel [Anaerolineae bacterium]